MLTALQARGSAGRRAGGWLIGLMALLALSGSGAAATAPLRIGVPYVPPPYTATDIRLYTEDGFELDLAKELGKRLETPVTLVPVDRDQRATALQSGAVDLLLGRAAAGDPLFGKADVLKLGFSSGSAVAMRTDTTIKGWEDLGGRTVCLSEGNETAQALAIAYGARVRVERAPARSLTLVRTGECDAAIHDQSLLAALFERKEWRKFSATLPSKLPSDLVLALPDHDRTLAARVEAVLSDLASDGLWSERRRRWAANVAFEVYLDQEAPDCH